MSDALSLIFKFAIDHLFFCFVLCVCYFFVLYFAFFLLLFVLLLNPFAVDFLLLLSSCLFFLLLSHLIQATPGNSGWGDWRGGVLEKKEKMGSIGWYFVYVFHVCIFFSVSDAQ